jgi:hypothetical protein
VSDAPHKLDATRRNLFDQNRFTFTRAAGAAHRTMRCVLGAARHLRRHVFYQSLGGGLHFQVYAEEALHNHGHRVYNNTFHENHCFAIGASADKAPR